MLVLCLDTSTADVAAAVVRLGTAPGAGNSGAGQAGAGQAGAGIASDETLAVAIQRDARGAGEHLLPMALAALAEAGCVLADLAAIAVGLGPGPYTSLRVGVVTAATLGLALDRPAYGACSLDLWGAPGAIVATDARRREVYWAAYDDTGARSDGPHVDTPAQLSERLAGRPVHGPGAALYPDLLGPGDSGPVPVARLAALVAEEVRAGVPGGALIPLYLRRPDAVPA